MKEDEWEKIEILPFGLSEEDFLKIKRNWIKKRMEETNCSLEKAKEEWHAYFENTTQKIRRKMLEKLLPRSSGGKKKEVKKEKIDLLKRLRRKK